VRLFTVKQLALVKVESVIFRELLKYLQPSLRRSILSRTTLTRYIGYAYEKSLQLVSESLHNAKSRVNIAFDL
jgi:hypothetical protein